MERQKLKEYLRIVVDMEKNVYLQEDILQRLQERYNNLAIRRDIPLPLEPQNITMGCITSIGLSLLLPVIGVIIGEIGKALMMTGILGGLIGVILAIVALFSFLLSPFAILMALIMAIKAFLDYKKAVIEYETAQAVYCQEIQLEDKRVQKEEKEKAVLAGEIDLLRKKNIQTKQALQRIYDENIIFPKYRNFVMVCSLYEYICAGRCDSLEGWNGAYNILENEIRLNHIITQLNRVLASLNQIQKVQSVLYSALADTELEALQLVNSSDKIINQLLGMNAEMQQVYYQIALLEKDSSVTEYYIENSKKERTYLEWVQNNINSLTE